MSKNSRALTCLHWWPQDEHAIYRDVNSNFVDAANVFDIYWGDNPSSIDIHGPDKSIAKVVFWAIRKECAYE